MSKLFFLTLAAVAACALAQAQPFEINDDPSQLALFETDEIETSGLVGEKKVFSDFCLSSRDEVRAFMRASVNDATSKVFNVMFNTIGEVSGDLGKVQSKAVAEGVELIKQSGIEKPASEARSKEEVEANIAENVDKVVKRGLLASIGDAVRVVLRAVIETISSETSKRLAMLKAQFNGENARDKIEDACRTITYQLKRNLEKSLIRTKSELSSSLTSEPDSLKKAIDMARLDDVGCTTTYRISQVSRFCDILLIIGPVFYPLVSL